METKSFLGKARCYSAGREGQVNFGKREDYLHRVNRMASQVRGVFMRILHCEQRGEPNLEQGRFLWRAVG